MRPQSNERCEAFHKDLTTAGGILAKVLASLDEQTNWLSCMRKLGHVASVAAMEPGGFCATERASQVDVCGNWCNGEYVIDHLDIGDC